MTLLSKRHVLPIFGIFFLLVVSSVIVFYKFTNASLVLSEKDEVLIPTPELTILPTPTATPEVIIKGIPVYITVSPEPTTISQDISQQTNAGALCQAKKQELAGGMAETINKQMANAEAEAKVNDPMYYQIWLSNIKPNIEIMFKNWTVKTLGEYEVYCLLHDGNDVGWKPSSGALDGINW